MDSIWSKEVKISERESLIGGQKVEAVVIGAGMAGILNAYYLKQSGVNVVVLEADKIAGGQTKNTTAKITSQHGMVYRKMLHDLGEEKAKMYADANEAAIKEYQKIIENKNISCNFESLPACLYSIKEKENLADEAEAAKSLGIAARFETKCELPFPIKGAVCFDNQAQFHPLKFLKEISKELTIYEHTRVISVKEHMVYTDRGNIEAEHIIFATHYPIMNVPGLYFLRQHQERSYVIAFKEAGRLNRMYYGIDVNGLSLRSAGDTILLGGSGHRTGENELGGAYEYLRKKAAELYPGHKETAHWSAQDCITHDGIPFIGKYAVTRPYWHIATGFKKWGMTSSMISAMVISDEICGRENPYSSLFTPQRFYCKASYKNLFHDIGVSIKGLVNGHFKKETIKCPHMGCELKWNPDEQSYDCPCHGSRFDSTGKLIDDPAQTDSEDIKKQSEML